MTSKDATAILRALAEGFDPRSGEELQPGSVCSDPQVIRALFFAVQHLQTASAAETPSSSSRVLPENAGKAWTQAEDLQLRAEFMQQKDIGALAHLHGRTLGSLSARLVRLGLVVAETPPPQSVSSESSVSRAAGAGDKPKSGAA